MSQNISPEDPSVLYLQATHVSSAVSSQNIDSIIKVKRCDNLVWLLLEENPLHPRVVHYINYMGLYGVIQCGFRAFDNHLITALVERWRRETHTFHLPIGEATITLQDVSIIWGLRIDGAPVTGIDRSRTVGDWQLQCQELLGFTPSPNYLRGGHLSMTALYNNCRNILVDDDTTEEDVRKYSRCVALMILSGIMFADYSAGSARLIFLRLLRDIDRVDTYSWGSAVLAFLYREMCNASQIGKARIQGPLYLLQIWAWSRIRSVNPDRSGATLFCNNMPDYHTGSHAPYGKRWRTVFSYTHVPKHGLRMFRDSLDRMHNNEFNWIVYNYEDADVKTVAESYDTRIWRCICPLICFDIVEMHRPNRVLRQFGFVQNIPVAATDNDALHNVNRMGCRNTDWSQVHSDAIRLWDRRLRHLVQGERHGHMSETTGDYMEWYHRITIRTISPTASGIGYRPHAAASGFQGGHVPFPPSPVYHPAHGVQSADSSSQSTDRVSGFQQRTDRFSDELYGADAHMSSSWFGGITGHRGGDSGPSHAFDAPLFGGTYSQGGGAGPSHAFDAPIFSGTLDQGGDAGPSHVVDAPMFGGTDSFLDLLREGSYQGMFGGTLDAEFSVQHGYHTPVQSGIPTYSDYPNVPPHNIGEETDRDRNVVSPVPFPAYEDAEEQERLGRGMRVKYAKDCGTGGARCHKRK